MNGRTQLASMAHEGLEKSCDFENAIKKLNERIRNEPDNHDHYFDRSICHLRLGDYQASLEDANTAISLDASHYNYHYQKALALKGLSRRSEAITSFKKAIELRARQSDSKLSDIFHVLRDASIEMWPPKERAFAQTDGATGSAAPRAERTPAAAATSDQGPGSNDPVDSTTDRLMMRSTASHRDLSRLDGKNLSEDGGNNLVATNCNTSIMNSYLSKSDQMFNRTLNRVTSSAGRLNSNAINQSTLPEISSPTTDGSKGTQIDQQNLSDKLKHQSQFDWNIRRSERIFLNHSSEPGSPGQQSGVSPRIHIGETSVGTSVHQHYPMRVDFNSPMMNSERGPVRRPYESDDSVKLHPPAKVTKEGTNSHPESDVDVDDSSSIQQHYNDNHISFKPTDQSQANKRVVIAPSSSMPVTGFTASVPSNKEDSYSSKYKRLRRDRERARRGTSKLCTIKASDLEDLHKPSTTGGGKRWMRVIAPIDGWLYSGQLAVDDNRAESGALQYVVKLDGDTTGSSYLFSQETVLNDVIKEVKVKSVSELRKGARICCYWSRQYKCLSTGVVTSRTFEATKSLVSVKYDNGDLSALPLEDLRLLPPDYPKYMSNCDPLLLSRNEDAPNPAVILTSPQPASQASNSRVKPESKSTIIRGKPEHEATIVNRPMLDDQIAPRQYMSEQPSISHESPKDQRVEAPIVEFIAEDDDEEEDEERGPHGMSDSGIIPQTDEIIDFITSEGSTKQDSDQNDSGLCPDQNLATEDKFIVTDESHLMGVNSRASSEENNYNGKFCPWMFDGPPKRNKRHGRTYRDNYSFIRRGNEVIKIGDSAELMPRDESILPFIGKVDGFWATGRGEMKVRVRWYYRLVETEGEPYELKDGENALFETNHFDENDVQSIYRSTKILSWTEYSREHQGHVNKMDSSDPKIFYLAGHYDPVGRVKYLSRDVKEAQ